MAWSSAISSGGYPRKIAAITASTRCLRQARAIAARAGSSSVEGASIITPTTITKPSRASGSDNHGYTWQYIIGHPLSGVYRPTRGPDEIARAAKAAKLSIVKVDLGTVRGKSEFLARLAKAFKCPPYFGMNWDALNDCLTDLSWLDDNGWVVILFNGQDFAAKNQDDFNTAIDVLQTAAEYWHSQAKPFWIFVYGDKDWNPGLPELANRPP